MIPVSFRLRPRGLAAWALLFAAAVAQAQGTPLRAERPDPLDAQARVPVATHLSALADYRGLGDDQRVPWKVANETVNRIGGWRAYAREAQQPEPAAAVPRPGAAAPADSDAASHRGHGTH